MKKQTALFFVMLLALTTTTACKNYLGNPYKVSQPERTVPAYPGDLRVDPPNWWTGMKHNKVELLIHREGVGEMTVRLGKEAKGVRIASTEPAESPNYLFATLEIAPDAPPQKVLLLFEKPESDFQFTHEYPIYPRSSQSGPQGVDASDIVYLVLPDRFANGDPGNDAVEGMLELPDRKALTGRHGGDLKGIMDHLDYIQDLGFTTLWLNPELVNDQKESSYHGYALTDHYLVDPRLGTNELLRDLVRDCHKRNLKVVRDVVLNHIGDKHYWMKDLPSQDWINQWPEFTRTNYKAPVIMDPYASESDTRHFFDGWFDVTMPDLNQRNPHVANYLIQQAIWWVEYAGFDGLRIDTYTYSDQEFVSSWCEEVRREYPDIGMFGEIWEHGVALQAYFADNQPATQTGFDSNLPGVIDFQLCYAFEEALTKPQGWTEGVSRIYYTLAKDYLYEDPYKNLIFLDNHDMTRIFSKLGEDVDKMKSALTLLLTQRGIPQIYYGTEILATGFEAPSHGNLRKDFPGGWPGDAVDKFTEKGRTGPENEVFDYLRTLQRYRNATPALQMGKLMQFWPENGVYTYFRYDKEKTVMVILNTNGQPVTLDTSRFAERIDGFKTAFDVMTGEILTALGGISLKKNSARVLELRP